MAPPYRLPVEGDTSGGTGAAAPTAAGLVGGVDGAGTLRALRVNPSGEAHVMPATGNGSQSGALEASHVVSVIATNPSRLTAFNSHPAVRYLHVFNAAALPANGTVPQATRRISGRDSATIDYDEPTGRFSVGLVLALSTTEDTLTLAGADALFEWDLYPTS